MAELAPQSAALAGDTLVPRMSILHGREQKLPAIPNPGVLPKSVRAAFAEVDALGARALDRLAEAYDLERTIPGVKADEEVERIAAARAGSKPKESSVPKIEASVRALRDEAATLKDAQRAALADAMGLLAGEDYEATFAKADKAVGDDLAAALAACDALGDAFDALSKSITSRRWVVAVAEGNHPPAGKIAYASAMEKKNGNPYEVRELVGLVRDSIETLLAQRAERLGQES